MNERKTWKTPALTPLGGASAEGAVVPPHFSAQMGQAKTNIAAEEGRTGTYQMNGMSYYVHSGVS